MHRKVALAGVWGLTEFERLHRLHKRKVTRAELELAAERAAAGALAAFIGRETPVRIILSRRPKEWEILHIPEGVFLVIPATSGEGVSLAFEPCSCYQLLIFISATQFYNPGSPIVRYPAVVISDTLSDQIIGLRKRKDQPMTHVHLNSEKRFAPDHVESNFGRYINTATATLNEKNNAAFVVCCAKKTVRIRAEAEIRPGDQLLVDYGEKFWEEIPDLPEEEVAEAQEASSSAMLMEKMKQTDAMERDKYVSVHGAENIASSEDPVWLPTVRWSHIFTQLALNRN